MLEKWTIGPSVLAYLQHLLKTVLRCEIACTESKSNLNTAMQPVGLSLKILCIMPTCGAA